MGGRTSALLAQHPSSRQKPLSRRWGSCRKPVQERSTPPTGGGDMRSNAAQLLRFTRDGGDVSGIRTNAAAELLGVSPNTLRSWERRFGYPKPRRTQGGHRQYELTELEALRRALLETQNTSPPIDLPRQRGEGPSSPSRLLDAFDHFDEQLADRIMEESLAVRSVERTVEEVLLPALEQADERDGRDAERELALRWATGWLHASRRVVPPASRPQGVLLFDSSPRLDVESLHVQALELGLRRAGFRTLLLAFNLPPERVVRAIRAVDPVAFVFCGGE